MDQSIPDDAWEPPPPPDPNVLKKKKYIRQIIILVIILILFRLFFFVVETLYKKSQEPDRFKYTPKIINQEKNTNSISVVGVVRISGLTDEEKQKNNLQVAKYQLTNFGSKTFQGVEGFYLQADNIQLDQIVGKCARITGAIAPDWKNKKELLYQRQLFIATLITALDYSNCDPYTATPPDSNQKNMIFDGSIRRINRPAPDIGYDYTLTLNVPFVSSDSASGLPQEVNEVTLVPSNDDVWKNIDLLVGKDVILQGPYLWGYAESKYVLVTGVKEKNEDIDLSHQANFVDTANWSLFENTTCRYKLSIPSNIEMTSGKSDTAIEVTSELNAELTGSEKSKSNWLKLNISCQDDYSGNSLKTIAFTSKNSIDYVKKITIKEKNGYVRLERQTDGTKQEIYLLQLKDRKILSFIISYSPFSTFIPVGRTILSTIVFME